MRTRKNFLILLTILAVVQIHALTKTIEIVEYSSEVSPQHVEGNTYRAADGTNVTLGEGQDPRDPKSYRDETGNHGVPTQTVTRRHTITIEIPDSVAENDTSSTFIESQFEDFCMTTYKPDETTTSTIAGKLEQTVEKKVLGIFPYEEIQTIPFVGKIETTVIKTQQKTIQKSSSVQIGDPVLMTSGQFRYDETDISVSAGNANLELGRHYQSGINCGESLGYGWFFSLDTRILRGTSILAETEFINANSKLSKLFEDFINFKMNTVNLIFSYRTLLSSIQNDITSTEKAIMDLNNSGYSSSYEVRKYLEDLNAKKKILQEVLTTRQSEFQQTQADVNSYSAEYQEKIDEAKAIVTEITAVSKLSVYNRNCNARSERGFGFDEHTNIGTEIIIVYDTYGRKSLYRINTEPEKNTDNTDNPYPYGAETENLSGGTDTLLIKPDGGYTLTKRDGTEWHYGIDGMLQEIEDRHGNVISISYENEDEKYICQNGRRLYLIESEGGIISTITNVRDPSDRIVYQYENGRLASVKDNDGDTISFGYTEGSSGLLEKIQKPDGSTVRIEYGYERAGEKLVSRTSNEENEWETFSYAQSGKKVEHTTHSGITTLYEYDTDLHLKKEIASDGTTKEYGYDDNGNVIWEKLNGNKTSFLLNRYGEKTRADYSDESFETWSYDEYGQVTSYKDRDGIAYKYTRDAQGNLTSVQCGGKTLYTYTYDAKGQVTSMTMYRADNTRYSQRFSYDLYGNMTERIIGADTNSASIKENWTYDNRNRVLSYAMNDKIEETYTYNGRDTIVTSSNGLVSTYTTDNRKDCTSIVEKDTLSGEIRVTKTIYDKRHLPIKRTLSSGEGDIPTITAEYRYLPGGEPLAELMRSGDNNIVTIYDYADKNGNQTDNVTKIQRIQCTESQLREAGACGTAGFSEANLNKLRTISNDTYSISYDREITQNGAKLTVTSPDGTRTVTEYDPWSRPIATMDASGAIQRAEYSPAGKLKRMQSAYGGYNVYSYDSSGYLSGTGRDGGIQASSVNNPDGNPYRVTDRKGRSTEYAYDGINRLVKVTQAAGSSYFFYDATGRVILAVTGGDGSVAHAEEYTSYEYSDDNRTVTASFGGLYSSTYTLNAWGETTSVTDGEGNSRTLCYDCAGRVLSETDAYGNITSYEYDARGLVTKAVYPDGTYNEYRYDVFGNMTESILCEKTVWQGSYDSAGRLVQSRGVLSPESSYVYDNSGRISEIITAGNLTSSYTYKDRGRTVTLTSGNGHAYTYRYDAYGLLSSETDRNGHTQSYSYDGEDEISSLIRFSGGSSSYSTTADGLTRKTTYSDGNVNTVEYSLSGKVKSVSNKEGTISYQYDKGGLLTKQTDSFTEETISYSYDRAGRRTRITGDGRNITMAYGKNGELTSIYDRVSNVGYEIKYDSMMREILRIGNNGVRTESTYNQDGSLDSIIMRDSRGIVLDAEAYVYDDDGRKEASISINGEVTLYEYDTHGRLSKILYPDNEASAEYEQRVIDEFDISERRYSSAESRYLSKKVYDKVARLQILCHNINSIIPSYRNFRVERLSYDADGNLTGRYIAGAFIEYSYDADDRLVSCTNGRKTLRSFKYDYDGNLVKISSPSAPGKDSVFTYDGSGRMISSVTHGDKGLLHENSYGYDALGRRVRTSGTGKGTVRTVYDGTSLEVFLETAYGANVSKISTSQESIIPHGERYRYIADNGSAERTETEGYIMTDTAGFRTRTTLYIGGLPAAVSADGESRYLGCDESGSVRLMTDSYGKETAFVSYDVFGTPVTGTSDSYGTDSLINTVLSRAAYAGKPYDYTTGFYDYGFRDYSPALSRFTTPDPIRDGTNWYAYCSCDPINFVDKWGLKIGQRNTNYLMSDSEWGNELTGNGVDYKETNGEIGLLRNTGCAITEMSNVISSATNNSLTPKDINNTKENFAPGTDKLYMQKLAEDNGLTFDYWIKMSKAI